MDIVEQIKALEKKIESSIELYKNDLARLYKTGKQLVRETKKINHICEVEGCYDFGIYENELYDSVCVKHKNYGK